MQITTQLLIKRKRKNRKESNVYERGRGGRGEEKERGLYCKTRGRKKRERMGRNGEEEKKRKIADWNRWRESCG